MPQIPSAIPSQAYEIIRNRIAEILIDELAEQAVLQVDDQVNATVFVERFVPFDLTELPAVNVALNTGNYDQQTVRSVDGTYRFNVDCHTKAKSTIDDRGDSLAMFRLQRLMATCQGILEDSRYKTLGFDAPFIERVYVDGIDIGDPKHGDGTSSVAGRINFIVRAPNDRGVVEPTVLAGYDTQVKIGLTEKGYIFSGNNTPVPPITGAEVQVNTTFYADVNDGDELNIPVVNNDGDSVGSVSSGVNVVVGDSTANLVNTGGTSLSSTDIVAEGSGNIVAPDATVQLNGSTIGTVQSGDTDSFPVLQDGSPVGSWNGSAFIIPSCPAGGGSIEATVSDSSPSLGDTITITGTASGYTPDSYLFFAYDGTGEVYFIAEQASNTFDWTVLNVPVGSYEVYVLGVENGTPDVNSYGTTSITISATFLMDLYPSLEGWAQVRLKAAFSSVLERIQRTSDNSENDFSLVGNVVDSSEIETFTGSSDGLLSYVTLQNGGGTDTQSIVADRPQVVNGGTINAINGIPTFIFNSNYLLSALQKGNDTSVFVVIRPDSFSGSAVNARVFDIKENGGDSIQLARDSSTGAWNMKNSSWQGGISATKFGVTTTGSLLIISCFFLSASNEMYINGVSQSASAGSNIGAVSGTQSVIGARSDNQGTTQFNGCISAVLVSQSDMRSDRLDIESRLTTLFT